MSIEVLIPTMNEDLVLAVLSQINKNETLPYRVTVINNSEKALNFSRAYEYPVKIVTPKKNVGVNPAWNYGLRKCKEGNHLSILNDDIEITPLFFYKIEKCFNIRSRAGVICPNVTSKSALSTVTPEVKIKGMKKREGWAFTIRNSLVKKIPHIPSSLKFFCGDDWIWNFTKRNKYFWFKDLYNPITHKVGETLRSNMEIRYLMNKEKEIYRREMSKVP